MPHFASRSVLGATLLALAAAPLALAACSDGSGESLGATESALPVGGGDLGGLGGDTATKDAGHDAADASDPIHYTVPGWIPIKSPPPAETCPSRRVDAHRTVHVCSDIVTTPPGGTGSWQVESTFPDAPAEVRDHFCRYTWIPDGACSFVPFDTLGLSTADGDTWSTPSNCPGSGAQCQVAEPSAHETSTPPIYRTGGGCPSCVAIAHNVAYVSIPDPAIAFRATNTAADTLGTTVVVIAHAQGVSHVFTATALFTHEIAIPLSVPSLGTYDVTAEAHWW